MSHVRSRSARPKARLIVAIDYGTTYSGLSFAMSSATDFRDIYPWTAYPGSASHHSGHCEKAPSLLAFAAENDELNEDVWGYQVEAGMKTYAWTKLLLDGSARPSEFDDPGLKKAIGSGIMKLPPCRTAKEIVGSYLRGLNTMYHQAVKEKYGEGFLDNLPVDFWLTVPATWSDEAKQLTLDAARDAGFASRPKDRLRLVSEPEAAAHLALKSSIHHVQDLIKVKAKVMVCDLGGGTVDITCYVVDDISPKLNLRELCIGGGGKCGATYVDRNFHKFMEKRFGEAFTSLEPEMIGPGSQFMDQFELAKRDFSMKHPRARPHRLHLHMASLDRSHVLKKHYDDRFDYVLVTQDDMEGLFDPVGDMIISLVADQVRRVRTETDESIDHLVVVGGFGSSPYILERLQEWCRTRSIRVTTLWSGAWSAVVCGAVLRGVDGAAITQKRCRRHYGHDLSRAYDPLKHRYNKDTRKVWRDEYDKADMLTGFLDWFIAKNEVLDIASNTNRDFAHVRGEPPWGFAKFGLWACSTDTAPDTVESKAVKRIGTIKYNLDDLDVDKVRRKKKRDGSTVYCLQFTLNVRMSADGELLEFKVLQRGKECGRAKLSFSYSNA